MGHHHKPHLDEYGRIVPKGTQLVEAMPSCAATKLVDQPTSDAVAAMSATHHEGTDFGDRGTERCELGTSNDAASHGRHDEPLGVLCQLGQGSRQQAAFHEVIPYQLVNRRCVGRSRFADGCGADRQGSTTKLENCQSSDSLTAGVPHFPNRRERLSNGVQFVWTDGQGPRYGPATSRMSR